MEIRYKQIRPTDKEHGHTQVFVDDEYKGYMMRNQGEFVEVGKTWTFSTQNAAIPNLSANTKAELIELLEAAIAKSGVITVLSVDFRLSKDEADRVPSKYLSLYDKFGKELDSGDLYLIGYETKDGEECDENGDLLG
jgi:hypothetical protein